MAKRPLAVSDEIAEHIAEVIEEMTGQIDGRPEDRMVEIDDDTDETIPLTARIEERYTGTHATYFAITKAH